MRRLRFTAPEDLDPAAGAAEPVLEAGGVLLKWLARAYEAQCAADGLGLCRT